MLIKLGYSQLQLYQDCPRKFYWQEECGLRPKWDGVPRPVGAAIHAGIACLYEKGTMQEALDAARTEWAEQIPEILYAQLDADEVEKVEAGWRQAEKCIADYKWAEEDLAKNEVVAVEKEAELPLHSDAAYRGRIDRVLKVNNDGWVHDTKTTGDNSLMALVQSHKVRHQYTGYAMLANELVGPIIGVMIDFVKKPYTRLLKSGDWTVKDPGYHREPHHISDHAKGSFILWFGRIVNAILESRKLTADKGYAWPQNTGQCKAWNRICPYYDLCRFPGRESEITATFVKGPMADGATGDK
jgi:hypothetical protein